MREGEGEEEELFNPASFLHGKSTEREGGRERPSVLVHRLFTVKSTGRERELHSTDDQSINRSTADSKKETASFLKPSLY